MSELLEKSDYKEILHSKRANIYYLEKCRILQKDGRVVYLTETEKGNLYWNIPIANTTVILLGNGTSITQAAVRLLCSAGVMVGFSGGGGTPLYAGTDIEWLSPQNEYRPTQYVQKWLAFWFDEKKRLCVAKEFQKRRCDFITEVWSEDEDMQEAGFYADDLEIKNAIDSYRKKIEAADSVTRLLTAEAELTRKLYSYSAKSTGISSFVRLHGNHEAQVDSKASDANDFLDNGNYLAYGQAACTLWVLGIPHGFAVMHGKTRKGALVFDVADLIKDAIVLPWSFIYASENKSAKEFRQQCLKKFTEHRTMDVLFEEVEKCCQIYL